MFQIIKAKLTNPDISSLLKNTGDAFLVDFYTCRYDYKWSNNSRDINNWTGLILMILRDLSRPHYKCKCISLIQCIFDINNGTFIDNSKLTWNAMLDEAFQLITISISESLFHTASASSASPISLLYLGLESFDIPIENQCQRTGCFNSKYSNKTFCSRSCTNAVESGIASRK